MKPQKALHKYKEDEKKTQNYRGHQYMMMPKIDGWYGYIDLGYDMPNAGSICSNAGRVIPSMVLLGNAVRNKAAEIGTTGRLVFEITVDGTPQFEIMNGVLNRKAICKEARLNVHDFIPAGKPMMTMDRYYAARELVAALDMESVEMINHVGASSVPEEWESKARQLIDKGHEGLILKKLDAWYTPGKRNADLMKIKEECEFDLVCVGMEKGSADGKYANTLGALVLQDKVGKKFTVSGMTDKQRSEWFNEPAKVVRHVVKVKAKNVMKDGSLREPRFNVIRFDKNIDDIDVVEPKKKGKK